MHCWPVGATDVINSCLEEHDHYLERNRYTISEVKCIHDTRAGTHLDDSVEAIDEVILWIWLGEGIESHSCT